MRLLSKKIIYGCEERGDYGIPYLTRYTLFQCKSFQICLHTFHRSDADDLHDHPWAFASLILWRGYVEQRDCPVCDSRWDSITKGWITERNKYGSISGFHKCKKCDGLAQIKRRVWPGMLLFRKATHRHRVELVKGKRAVTLVFMGRRVRDWGFFTKAGWVQWMRYFIQKRC